MKSLFILFAVIAATSALRLPVDLKAGLAKIDLLRQKDAEYESESMADLLPEVPENDAHQYENKDMADTVPEVVYQREAFADVIPEETFESEAIADEIPEVPENDVHQYESNDMADTVPEVVYQREAFADVIPEQTYENEAMADEIPEVAPPQPIAVKTIAAVLKNLRDEGKAHESKGTAVAVPEEVYESEAMADVIPESAYESESMADLLPEVPENDVHQYESNDMADTVPEVIYPREIFAEVIPEKTYESEAMADTVPEVVYPREVFAEVIPKETYESEAMADTIPEVVPQPRVIAKAIAEGLMSLHEQVQRIYESKDMADVIPEEVQTYESENMADPVYETKNMADEPYESAHMKDEFEKAMANFEKLTNLKVVFFGDDVGDSAFGRRFPASGHNTEDRRFSADLADEEADFAEAVSTVLQKFAVDAAAELARRFKADGHVKFEDLDN